MTGFDIVTNPFNILGVSVRSTREEISEVYEFNLPNDGTGIDGIYEERGGSQIAYQVKYRKTTT